jgi:transcriptional regulator with XRE-family HTH domain
MTQRDLADALGREHGMVARIELGERRVDLVEAYQLFGALGASPEREVAALMRKFEKAARQLRKGT